jgi:acetylornithine deacetylase/succinyl-diaminopimelate desuccinylase-like protein
MTPRFRSTLAFLLLAGSAVVTHGAEAPADAKAEARSLFASIIGFESSIGKAQVPTLANFIADRLKAGGFPETDVHVVPFGDTASLVARYRGNGRGGKPIALMAHLDVVTAKRSDWQKNPFELIEENGYFFGRGTLDVKSEVALLTETFLRLKREGFVPSRDLILVFTGDEETAQDSTADLVRNHRDLVDAEFALNGDGGGGVLDAATGKPLLYYVQGAEKSSAAFSLTTRNPGGHSSQPRADNAIYELADALRAIRGYRFRVQWNDWTIGDFKASGELQPGALGKTMLRFAANPKDTAAAETLSRYPEYVGKVRTTCVATMLTGGHAENALPQSANATINCRIFPGMSPAEVQSTLQRLAGSKVEIQPKYEPLFSAPSPLRTDVMQAVSRAIAAANPGARIVPTMAAYATDGSVFRAGGIPTYGVGSTFIKASDEFAHGLDERLPVASFYHGLTHWHVLITTLAGTP